MPGDLLSIKRRNSLRDMSAERPGKGNSPDKKFEVCTYVDSPKSARSSRREEYTSEIRKRKPDQEEELTDDEFDGENEEEISNISHGPKTNWPLYGIFIVIALVCMAYSYIYFIHSKEEVKISNTVDEAEETLRENLLNLNEKFPSQNNDTWATFFANIKSVARGDPKSPSVFLLLYEGSRDTSTCLAKQVGKAAVQFLTNSSGLPVVVDGGSIKRNKTFIDDYGSLTETHKHDIEKIHVMIIFDLHEIPAIVARAFHSLCDTYNPLIKEATYMFTMKIMRENHELRASAIAEKTLKALWQDSLGADVSNPLITRITDNVISIKPEALLPC